MRLRFAALLFVAAAAQAQKLDVTVLDVPYNVAHGLRGPSMQQSLTLTATTYDLVHLSLQNIFGDNHPVLNDSTVAAFDILSIGVLPLPLTDAWLHEEWHRAVMGSRGINSFDDVYKFDVGATAINVSHVRDEDLVRLKADHPADLVRLDEAGVEGETMLVQRLEKEHFFSQSCAYHIPLYLLMKLGVYAYIDSATDPASDVDTDESNAREGANIPRRDFTGHDFLGWMYDLSRPDEPYAARGIHPSGVGINRYRKTTDLTAEELRFLDKQGKLSLLNFLDPNIAGIDNFRTGRVEWNAMAAHYLTSFGYTIDANVFLHAADQKLFVTLHRYTNHDRSFPGAEVEWIDRPVGKFLLTPRVAVWSQPDDQRFRTSDGKMGGLAGLRVDMPLRGLYGSYIAVDAKTAGWVAGNEYLGSNVSLRFGVTRKIGGA